MWRFRTTVSKGTYLRAIARDLGRSLGTVAHLSALRRTRSGAIDVSRASTIADVQEAGEAGLERLFIPSLEALALPVVDVSGARQRDVGNGRPLPRDAADVGEGQLLSVSAGTRLLAVYVAEASRLTPEVVVAGGCA
jgi:tRNA pseudouridine55 synthase